MPRKDPHEKKKSLKVRKYKIRKNLRHIRSQFNHIMLESFHGPYNKANQAEWHESNGQKYLEINASDYYNLGLMEGKELGAKIRAMKLIIKAISAATRLKGYNYKRFLEMAKGYEDAIPDEFLRDADGIGTYIDEIQGISDALKGITFEDVFLQNCFIDIVYGELIPFGANIPEEYEFGCTTFGALNPNYSETGENQTSSHHVYIGQNFDFNITFKPTLSFVLHKVANRPRIFCLRMGGMLALPTGLNEWGHRVCINVVKSNISGIYTIPSGFITRQSLCHSQDAETAYSFLYKNAPPNSFNIMLADFQKLISCETVPTEHIRYDIDSCFASSNTFIAPEFQKHLVLPEYSKERQAMAESLIQKAYERGIDYKDIIKILATKPIICRTPKNVSESRTLAFITNDYFGIGNPADDPWGFIPLDPKKANLYP